MSSASQRDIAAELPSCMAVSKVARNASSLPNLIDVMCRAFERDDHINWLLRQDTQRETARAQLFCLLLSEMGGELYASTDRNSAALWFPPHTHSSWGAQSRFFLHLLSIAGPLQAIRRGIDLKRMDRCHPKQPHYYLQLLGVAPEYQRKGYGNALLSSLIAQARAADCPIYLETSSTLNAAFYSKLGFANTFETTLSDGLRLWSMIWRPQRSA